MTMQGKLQKISSEENSSWIDEAEQDLRQARVRQKSWKLALRVLALLREKGMTQAELAEQMNVSRQQVTKIVKGKENLTLETIDKLEQALGETLWELPLRAPANQEVSNIEASYTAIATIAAAQHSKTGWTATHWMINAMTSWAVQLETIDRSALQALPYLPPKSSRLMADFLAYIHQPVSVFRTIPARTSDGCPIEERCEDNWCYIA